MPNRDQPTPTQPPPTTPPPPANRRDHFDQQRAAAQARLEATPHLGIKRFLSLDAAAYRDRTEDAGLDTPTKELLGLAASAVLRCDDCINYHIAQAVDHGWTREQIEDALNVALVVGGSIVIPHARRAMLFLDDCLAKQGVQPRNTNTESNP